MLAKEPADNAERLEVLRNFGILDTGTEKIYDDLTGLTADLCDVPVCLISLVEQDRQWFKSEIGLGICETSIEESVCSHAIVEDNFLEIPDTRLDPRTDDNALCQGDKPFLFYAGAILRSLNGRPLGTLCVLDYKPRTLTSLQKRILSVHASSVTRQLELTRAYIHLAKTGVDGIENFITPKRSGSFYQETRARFESLTPREREITKLIAGRSGSLSSKQIGKELAISHRTVDHHRASIMTKMNVESIAELIAISLKSGILR